jgi:hypothetical protein
VAEYSSLCIIIQRRQGVSRNLIALREFLGEELELWRTDKNQNQPLRYAIHQLAASTASVPAITQKKVNGNTKSTISPRTVKLAQKILFCTFLF